MHIGDKSFISMMLSMETLKASAIDSHVSPETTVYAVGGWGVNVGKVVGGSGMGVRTEHPVILVILNMIIMDIKSLRENVDVISFCPYRNHAPNGSRYRRLGGMRYRFFAGTNS
jgi:hypothetical protein